MAVQNYCNDQMIVELDLANKFFAKRGHFEVGPTSLDPSTSVYKIMDNRAQIAWRVPTKWSLDNVGNLTDPRNPYEVNVNEPLFKKACKNDPAGFLIFCGKWNDETRNFIITKPSEAEQMMYMVFAYEYCVSSEHSSHFVDELTTGSQVQFRYGLNIEPPQDWTEASGGLIADSAKSYEYLIFDVSPLDRALLLKIECRQAEKQLRNFEKLQIYAYNADKQWRRAFELLQPAATNKGFQLDMSSWKYQAFLLREHDAEAELVGQYFYTSEDLIALAQRISEYPNL